MSKKLSEEDAACCGLLTGGYGLLATVLFFGRLFGIIDCAWWFATLPIWLPVLVAFWIGVAAFVMEWIRK